MTITVYKPKMKMGRRGTLSPKPVLDRKTLNEALIARNLSLKDIHLDTFYQLLHRQNYPTLIDFVSEYHKNENSTDNNSNSCVPKRKIINRLPKDLLDFLADPSNDFTTITSTIQSQVTSKDGTTTKLAIRLQDGHLVESVIMRHMSSSGSRVTLCVSSQVGCKMACNFCATGTMGFRGNLMEGEILEQLVHAGHILNSKDGNSHEFFPSNERFESIRNVVFMGMGEPLDNYVNVLGACRAMIDRRRWNLAYGHVTVSTVGITSKMRQLTRDLPEINIALSLHAPNDSMRQKIVPTSRMYYIDDMIEALDEHMMASAKLKKFDVNAEAKELSIVSKRKKAMIEYVMLDGETSSFECAHQLGKLCEHRHLVVNLIPYNKTDVQDKLSCPSIEHVREFQRIVSSYGVFCSIRSTMGADISGACGQLVVEQGNAHTILGDIEDSHICGDHNHATITKKHDPAVTFNMNKRLTKIDSTLADPFSKLSGKTLHFFGVDRNKLVKSLKIATSVSFTAFVLSSMILLCRKRKV